MPTINELLKLSMRVLQGARRNPEPLRAFAKIATSASKEERQEGLADLVEWTQHKRLAMEREEGLQKAKGFAQQLLRDLPQVTGHLDAMPHLGALSPLSRTRATRLDYVAFTIGALLDLKVMYPSLGLGSNNHGIEYRGKSLSGLEVAQTLALATNLGHLFGTFSTERALLFALDDNPSRLREFTSLVPSDLRAWAGRVLEERNLYRFFYVLAAIEISRLKCDRALRDVMLQVLLAFEAAPTGQSAAPLSWAFRKARQLAYHRIQSLMGLGMSLEEKSYAHVFTHMRDSDVFGFDTQAPPTHIENVLSALDQLHSENIFTEPGAARLVLNHLREFRTWWREHETTKTPLSSMLSALMERPVDWPSVERNPLSHYLRIRLPQSDMNWISEVRTWRNEDASWPSGSTFLLTPTPSRKGTVGFLVDLYIEHAISSASRYQVARVLAGKNRAMWAHAQTDNARLAWRAVALFGARLLQDSLRPEFAVLVQPVPGRDGHSGYAIACEMLEPGCSKMKSVAAMLLDEGRQQEVEGLVELRRQRPPADDSVWIAFLGRVIIVDRSSRQTAAEIDGLWIDISKVGCRWTAMEHKSGKGRGRVDQLEKLSKLIGGSTTKVTQAALAGGDLITWIEFPEPIDPPPELP